ncbi:MAG: nucleotidyltransferase family protein, partial [Dehalococcoidia bacterium]|nr:nucleotidyltransferase family protein [Dehalococcoidia bacterium]
MPDAKGESGPFLAGVILAAGASTRMGQPKQLLAYRGRPLLQRVVDAALASSLDEVVVVLGHRAEEVRAALELPPDDRIRLVVNPDYAAGQSTSLRCGLRSASSSATGAAVLLGDQPHVSAALIDRIAQAFRSADRPIVRPVYPVIRSFWRDGSGRRSSGCAA